MEHREVVLSPLDHLMARRHTTKVLYFPLLSPNIARISSVLKSSFQRLFETLPILSGTVQSAPHQKKSGLLCVDAPWNKVDEVFRVNDLTSSDLDYDHMRKNHFPMTIWNEDDIKSVYTSRPSFRGGQNPVMMAQVNFVRNGMILVIFLHHSVMDGLGAVAVTELWAILCAGKDGAEMIRGEMMNRQKLMSGDEAGRLGDFKEYVNLSESGKSDGELKSLFGTFISHLLATFPKRYHAGIPLSATQSSKSSHTPNPSKEVDTEIFFFSRSKLAALKSVVSASVASMVPSSEDCKAPSYISTNDALSALLFACVTEARKPFCPTDTQQTIPFALAVSGRRLLDPPLPEKYLGNVVLFCHLNLPLHAITPEVHNIGSIAAQTRSHLSQLDEPYVRKLIGALHKVDDTSKVVPACRMSKDWPFTISSWAGQAFCSMDWGSEIGAKCERVRPPMRSEPGWDGLIIILPELKAENCIKDEEAGLEVMVGLEKRAMRRLRGMEEWTTWAQWRCS